MRDVHQEQHGRDRSGPGDHRNRKRKDGGIFSFGSFALFLRRALRTGRPGEQHVDGDQKEQDAARNREGRQRDAEIAEQGFPDQPHYQH